MPVTVPFYLLVWIKRPDFQMLCCCLVSKLFQLLATPWTAAHQASLSFTVSWSLLKLMSVMLSNHLILCRSLLLLLSIIPIIRSFPVNWLFASGGQNIGASA